MEYLNSILSQQNQRPQSVEEAIPTLCNRLQHATLAPDRRSAVLGLKSFSRQYRETVVEYGLRSLISTLKKDRESNVLVKAVLETLLILFLRAEEDDTLTRGWISQQSRMQNGKYPSPLLIENVSIDQFSLWIADEITQDQNCINLLLEIIQSVEDFHIRLYTIQLFEFLVSTRAAKTKDNFLNHPTSISTLVALLNDSHDQIRNEAILLLMAVVNKNFNIQKLVAFENTFDTLFDIIAEEGGIRGSILVQDCLSLITNLLQYNASNQKYFIETQCLLRLAKVLGEPVEDVPQETEEDIIPIPPIVWTEQRLQNMIISLEICNIFVTEDNGSMLTNQEKMFNSGILFTVLKLVFSPTIDNKVRVSALETTSNLIRRNPNIQLQFSQIDIPCIDPTLPSQIQTFEVLDSVPMALLNWALNINSVHAFEIRLNAANCLHAYFKDNKDSKKAFLDDQIRTYSDAPLNGSYEEANSNNGSAVKVRDKKVNLFATLMDYDTEVKLNPYKCWFSAVILIYLFEEDDKNKDIARNVKTGDEEAGEEVMNSIQAFSGLLITSLESRDPRIAIGYLMVLTVWFYEDSQAVDDFLSDQSIINSIVAYVSNNSTNSSEVVVGMATILMGVVYEFSTEKSAISRTDLYTLLSKGLGKDNYSMIVKQFKNIESFKTFDEDSLFNDTVDDTGLPVYYFDPIYVNLVKENFPRIKRALFRDPSFQAYGKLNYEVFDELDQRYKQLQLELEKVKSTGVDEKVSLEQQLQAFKEKSDMLSKTLEDVTKELTELRGHHEKVDQLQKDTQKKLDSTNKAKVEFEELSSKYAVELNDALKKADKSSEIIKNLETKIEQSEQVKKKQEAGINNMTRDLFHLKKQKNDFENTIKALEKDMLKVKDQNNKTKREYDQKLEDLSNLNKSLNQKIIRLEESLKEMSSKNDDMMKKLEESENKNSDLQESSDHLIQKLRSAGAAYQNLKQEKIKLEEAMESNKSEKEERDLKLKELDDLKNEITTAKTEKEELRLHSERVRFSLEDRIAALEKESASLNDKRISVEASKSELTQSITKLKEQAEAEKKKAQEEINRLKAENGTLGEKIKDLTSLKDQESEKSRELSTRLDDIMSRYDQSQEEMKSKKLSLYSEKTKLESELAESRGELKETSKSYLDKLASLDEERRKLDSVLKEKESMIKDHLVEKEKAFKEVAAKKLEIKGVQEELTKLQSELSKTETSNQKNHSELTTRISELELSNSKLLDEVASKKEEIINLKSKTDEEIKKLNASVLEKSETITALENQLKDQTTKSKTEVTGLEKRIDDLKQKHDDILVKHEEASTSHERAKSTLEENLASSQKLNFDLERKFEEESKAVLNKGEELKSKIAILQSLEEENKAKDKIITGLKAKVENKNKEYDDYKSKSSKDVAKADKRVKSQDAQILSLKNDLKDKLMEIQTERDMVSRNSEDVVSEYTQKLKKLEKEHADLKEEHGDILTKHSEERNEMLEQAKKLETELTSFKKNHDEVESKVKQLEEVRRELEKKLRDKNEERENLKSMMNSKMEDLKRDVLGLKEKTEALEKELKNEVKSNELKNQEVEEKSSKLESAEDRLRVLEKNLKESQKSDNAKTVESQKLIEKQKALLSEIEEFKKVQENNEKQLENLKGEKQSEDSTWSRTEGLLSDLHLKLTSFTEQTEDSSVDPKNEDNDIVSTSPHNPNRLEILCSNISQHIDRIKGSQSDVNADKDKISQLTQDLESKNTILKDLEEKLKSKEKVFSLFKGKLSDLENEKEKLEASLKQESSGHEALVANLKKELDASSMSLDSKKTEVSDFENKFKKLEEDGQSTKKSLKESSDKVRELETALKAKESQMSDLKEELSKLKESASEGGRKEKENAKEITTLKDQIKDLQKNPSKDADTVPKSDLDDMMLLMMDLDEKIRKYKTKLSSLGEEVTSDEDSDKEDEDDKDQDSD